jgi:hypothetical protein
MKRNTVFSPNTFIESYFKENQPASVHKGSFSDFISSQLNLYSEKSSNFTRSPLVIHTSTDYTGCILTTYNITTSFIFNEILSDLNSTKADIL